MKENEIIDIQFNKFFDPKYPDYWRSVITTVYDSKFKKKCRYKNLVLLYFGNNEEIIESYLKLLNGYCTPIIILTEDLQDLFHKLSRISQYIPLTNLCYIFDIKTSICYNVYSGKDTQCALDSGHKLNQFGLYVRNDNDFVLHCTGNILNL